MLGCQPRFAASGSAPLVVALRAKIDSAPANGAGAWTVRPDQRATPPAPARKVLPMSAYVLSWDHIGVLVNIGYELGVRGVAVPGGFQDLALDDERDRGYVAAELMAQNRTSVAHRYGEPVNPAADIAQFRLPPRRMNDIADYVQALQWVRCYRYQSCEDPGWPATFAFHYTERLRCELEAKMIASFTTTWDYNGPELVVGMSS